LSVWNSPGFFLTFIEIEREKKFIEKYGPKSQWSEEVKGMFEDSLEDPE